MQSKMPDPKVITLSGFYSYLSHELQLLNDLLHVIVSRQGIDVTPVINFTNI